MSAYVLGLDLGPSSLGWALLDEREGEIAATGVRVFPEGVDRDTQGREISKNAQRRLARAMRRQIARRAGRKRHLREVLVGAGLLPEVALLPREDQRRTDWERDEFKKDDPYTLRSRAFGERLGPHEIGRVLVHLNQRRGFRSNRKADRAAKKETSDLLVEIGELAAKLGDRTLGQYLADQRPEDRPGERSKHHLVRLRGLHTRRDMYEREFAAIWEHQHQFHPDVLTDDLRERIKGVIFFQRELRPPSPGLVGRCELEPRLPRCARADRRAQRFRLLNEVNNLRVIDLSHRSERKLTDEERSELLAFLSQKKERKFDEIRKHLFEQHENTRFNLEAGERPKMYGMPVDAMLAHKDRLGKAWHKTPNDLKDRIVAAIIDDEPARLGYLLAQAGFDEAVAESLLDGAELEDGYVSYSLHAIKKLLPFLEKGLPLTSREADKPCAICEAGYMLPWQRKVDGLAQLPEPPEVTNPLVRQALHEVRKTINAILREFVERKGHRLSAIHVELAREVRGTAKQRALRAREIEKRHRLRDDAADTIREYGCKATAEAIDRYLLWKEQGEECLYCGRALGMAALLGGEVQIDHILPYRRSLDDSLMNKVVTCPHCNAVEKQDRTPFEWLAKTDVARYETILQRARKLHYAKQKRLLVESIELDDFFARQLVDTAYITSQVHEYVRCLCPDVLCMKGQHTSTLRRQWGLNTVLSRDGSDLKNRDDHRHHAVDAIVVALTNRRRLQALADVFKRRGDGIEGQLPEPWSNFRADVEKAVNEIHVSYRVRRRVAGALHDKTIYGPTDTPGEFACRKALEDLTPAMVPKIRDRVVRELVEARLHSHGIEPGRRKGEIPAETWKEPLWMPTPRRSEFAGKIPIRKVRLVIRNDSIRAIRDGSAFVEPGSTHHLCIFEVVDSNGKTRREAVFVTMLDAAERLANHQPLIQRAHPTKPNTCFLMSLAGNELVLLQHKGKEDLYRFETAASTSQQMWFRHHTFAGKSSDKWGRISKKPNTLVARKVTVDPLGRIRTAND